MTSPTSHGTSGETQGRTEAAVRKARGYLRRAADLAEPSAEYTEWLTEGPQIVSSLLWQFDHPEAAAPGAAALDPETLRQAVHDWFEAHTDDGCVHFDHGHGPYRLCDDPDQGVPVKALPAIFSALSARAAEPKPPESGPVIGTRTLFHPDGSSSRYELRAPGQAGPPESET